MEPRVYRRPSVNEVYEAIVDVAGDNNEYAIGIITSLLRFYVIDLKDAIKLIDKAGVNK